MHRTVVIFLVLVESAEWRPRRNRTDRLGLVAAFQRLPAGATNGSEKLRPANVFVDDEDAKVVALGICGKDEKAELLRIVCVRCPHQGFAIAEGDFKLPAGLGRSRKYGFLVLWASAEVLHEENRLEVFQLDVCSPVSERIRFRKKPKAVLYRGKVVNVALQSMPIQVGNDSLISVLWGFWRRRHHVITSTGISDFNFIFAQDHKAATLSCQSRIAMAAVKWVAAAIGSFSRSAGWLGLALASDRPRR